MSQDTVHKNSTPHSYGTPHKYPSVEGNSLEVLNALSMQLYPTGRAWYRTENGTWEKFHEAINRAFSRLISEAKGLINSTFPDNEDFSSLDATLWEFRLGLITNEETPLETRKQAIKRKLGHPNNIKARQHPLFIQNQLQLAGFNVWVHENIFPYQTPNDITNQQLTEVQHGGLNGEETQHGNSTQHGGNSFDVIANSIEEIETFAIGGLENLWATFFIGGENLGDIAEIPVSRLREFKELVIKLKPAHTVAFTFINYI